MSDWKLQLQQPLLRQYATVPKHSGGFTPGRQGTIMDLSPLFAEEVLRAARYDTSAASGEKAPSLWGYYDGRIYRFMWDNVDAWHGYPTEEKPPNDVLRQWRQNGNLTQAELGKIRRLPGRGN
jgi:hypothetical protein